MTGDGHFKWSSEPLYICLYLGLNPCPEFLDKCDTCYATVQGLFNIYDIMHYLESKDIPGLLMLIDFEKAFDSVSWPFLYSVLDFFNFGFSFITWIKTFNSNINASILQMGFLSDSFAIIERGCRQGDPIAPYLFLLCAQILFLMIDNNKYIKGITVKDHSFNISQFADDTTLVLDGSKESLLAALNTLEIFGNISGLKLNVEKTKLVWLGKKALKG